MAPIPSLEIADYCGRSADLRSTTSYVPAMPLFLSPFSSWIADIADFATAKDFDRDCISERQKEREKKERKREREKWRNVTSRA